MKPKDLTGIKFNFLTPISLVVDNQKRRRWLCKCDCGNEKIVRQEQIINGQVKHCCASHHKSGNLSKMFRGIGNISQQYWNKLIKSANKRNIDIDLTLKEISDLFDKQNGKCSLSGINLSTVYPNHTASLDRIDSNKCYKIDNVQWVHKDVNFMKTTLSQNRLIELCKLITENLNE